MATVYLADDLKHERKVALKVLKPELAAVVGHWLIGPRMIIEARGLLNCGCRLRRPSPSRETAPSCMLPAPDEPKQQAIGPREA